MYPKLFRPNWEKLLSLVQLGDNQTLEEWLLPFDPFILIKFSVMAAEIGVKPIWEFRIRVECIENYLTSILSTGK